MAKTETNLSNLVINVFDDVEDFNNIAEPDPNQLYLIPVTGLRVIADDGSIYVIGVGTTEDGDKGLYIQAVK